MSRFCLTGFSFVGLFALAAALVWIANEQPASAHCQVPCGIYDDAARVVRLREDAATIAKAIKKINELSATSDAQSLNQATRWIGTKEAHASHIIEVVAEYFLTQKLKPAARGAGGYDAYLEKLADHHRVMVAAMKTKQSADTQSVKALQSVIDALAVHYGG